MGSSVDEPLKTLSSLTGSFSLGSLRGKLLMGLANGTREYDVAVVQAYTRAAQYESLPAHSSYRLSKSGKYLSMLNCKDYALMPWKTGGFFI